ncbi:MAG: F0F1 ATP synthase subunit B [Actinobacteria bacterium]|nr:F0F1 ATP synthase subunit B [Actinomycetota bacterium]
MGNLDGVQAVYAAQNPLLKVSPGVMIWTLVIFGITLLILKKYVFGPVSEAIERRRTQIAQSIEEAEQSRDEAQRLLADYKVQLADARKEADALRERGRKDGERQREEIVTAAESERSRIVADTQDQVNAQTRQAMSGIRDDVAGLAVAAAEKVTRKSLSDDDHRRLIEEALREIELEGATA